MLDKDVNAWDEATTSLLRTIPGFLWSFFKSLVDEGFTREEALNLTTTYLISLQGQR